MNYVSSHSLFSHEANMHSSIHINALCCWHVVFLCFICICFSLFVLVLFLFLFIIWCIEKGIYVNNFNTECGSMFCTKLGWTIKRNKGNQARLDLKVPIQLDLLYYNLLLMSGQFTQSWPVSTARLSSSDLNEPLFRLRVIDGLVA